MTAQGAPREAGREMNRLMAEQVMGWRPVAEKWTTALMHPPEGYEPFGGCITFGKDGRATEVPPFSTNIAAAFLVVESRPLGVWNWRFSQGDDGFWWAEIRLGYETSYSRAFGAKAKTLPLAICLAALSLAPPSPGYRLMTKRLLLAGLLLVAGCGHDDKVRSYNTEQDRQECARKGGAQLFTYGNATCFKVDTVIPMVEKRLPYETPK